jgi:hypothetical protein
MSLLLCAGVLDLPHIEGDVLKLLAEFAQRTLHSHLSRLNLDFDAFGDFKFLLSINMV